MVVFKNRTGVESPVKVISQEQFLVKLAKEARLQARLESKKILPEKLDFLVGFIGRYTWQILLLASGFLATLEGFYL